MKKHSSHQFGDQFSGCGRQSEKFSRIGACIRRNFTPWSIGFVLGSYFAVSFFFYSLPQYPSLIDQFLCDTNENRFFKTIARSLAWTIADSVLITPLCLLPFSQKIPLKRYDRHHQPFEGVKFWAGVLWALKGAPGPNIWTFPFAIFAFGFMLLSFQAQFTSSLSNSRVFDYMPDYRPFVTAAGDCIFQSWQPLLGFQSFKFTIRTQKRPYTEKTCIFSKLLQ